MKNPFTFILIITCLCWSTIQSIGFFWPPKWANAINSVLDIAECYQCLPFKVCSEAGVTKYWLQTLKADLWDKSGVGTNILPEVYKKYLNETSENERENARKCLFCKYDLDARTEIGFCSAVIAHLDLNSGFGKRFKESCICGNSYAKFNKKIEENIPSSVIYSFFVKHEGLYKIKDETKEDCKRQIKDALKKRKVRSTLSSFNKCTVTITFD